MAVTLDTSVDASGTSLTGITLTAGAMTLDAAANLLVIFAGWGVGSISASFFVDAQVNGVSIFANKFYTTKTDGNFEGVGACYQKNPVTGSSQAYFINYNFSGGVSQGSICAASFKGADVAGTTFGTEITNSANNSSGTIGPFTSSSGDLIVGNIASDANVSITAGDTEIQKEQGIGGDSSFGAEYSATVNDTLTWSQSTPDTGWAAGGNVIKGVASSGDTQEWMPRATLVQTSKRSINVGY